MVYEVPYLYFVMFFIQYLIAHSTFLKTSSPFLLITESSAINHLIDYFLLKGYLCKGCTKDGLHVTRQLQFLVQGAVQYHLNFFKIFKLSPNQCRKVLIDVFFSC